MKYEFIDDYLYIDGEKIEIKFEFLSYKRSAFCLSGEYEGGIKTKQVQNKDNFCTNLVCDYDYEQYKVYFFLKYIFIFHRLLYFNCPKWCKQDNEESSPLDVKTIK